MESKSSIKQKVCSENEKRKWKSDEWVGENFVRNLTMTEPNFLTVFPCFCLLFAAVLCFVNTCMTHVRQPKSQQLDITVCAIKEKVES